MNDYKQNTKMKSDIPCYKEGGSVYKSRHSEKSEMKEDISKDKKVVKKAFAMHDKQEHPGEKTDLSKLKKGGRAKKECGTVKKYKCGGGVFGAKKTKEDIKNMDDAKDCKPKMLAGGGSALKDVDAEENPGLAELPTNVRNKMGYKRNGGKVKKMMTGGTCS